MVGPVYRPPERYLRKNNSVAACEERGWKRGGVVVGGEGVRVDTGVRGVVKREVGDGYMNT